MATRFGGAVPIERIEVEMGISAVDVALWDLKAKLLEVPLCTLLGRRRDRVELYGSGGFTSYSNERLAAQLRSRAGAGLRQAEAETHSFHR